MWAVLWDVFAGGEFKVLKGICTVEELGLGKGIVMREWPVRYIPLMPALCVLHIPDPVHCVYLTPAF